MVSSSHSSHLTTTSNKRMEKPDLCSRFWTSKKQISELKGCPEMPLGFSGGLKKLPANAGDGGSIPGWGRPPGEGNSNPLQSSCLENSLDREAWRATVHGVAKDRTQLSAWAHMHAETPLTGNGMKETHHKITIQNSRGHYGRILDLCSICELLKKYKLNKINTALKINHAFLSS